MFDTLTVVAQQLSAGGVERDQAESHRQGDPRRDLEHGDHVTSDQDSAAATRFLG